MENLFGKRVLITGASGFIGSHLLNRLSQFGLEIHALSRSSAMKGEGVHWVQADVAEMTNLRNVFSRIKPHIIFHLASQVTGSRDLSQVEPTLRNNFITTVNLLALATEYKCERLILIGSMEEPDISRFEVASSPYSAAKGASSEYARMFFNLYGTPVVNATLYMVYGPNQKDSSKLIPYVTNSLLQNLSPKLSSGLRQVDWIYVDDVVEGLLLMAATPALEGRRIDLGSGVTHSIRSVVEILGELTNSELKPQFNALQDRPMERTRVADVGSAFQLIGWKPKTGLHEGLAKTVHWYRHFNQSTTNRSSEHDAPEKIGSVQPL
jgi:UDP-glucose 4-epimerase